MVVQIQSMKLILGILLYFTTIFGSSYIQNDVMDVLFQNFKTGSAKELGKHLSSSVDLILVDEEDVYSKAQAEQILRDFFIKNPPSSFTKIHTVGNASSKNRFGVILLTTKTGKFRISLTLTKVDANFLLNELRIEPEK